VTIPEISGEVDLRSLERELNTKCGAATTVVDGSGKNVSLATPGSSLILLSGTASATLFNHSPQVLSLEFPAPAKTQPERSQDILDQGRLLHTLR
jgi:hypothetical protein